MSRLGELGIDWSGATGGASGSKVTTGGAGGNSPNPYTGLTETVWDYGADSGYSQGQPLSGYVQSAINWFDSLFEPAPGGGAGSYVAPGSNTPGSKSNRRSASSSNSSLQNLPYNPDPFGPPAPQSNVVVYVIGGLVAVVVVALLKRK